MVLLEINDLWVMQRQVDDPCVDAGAIYSVMVTRPCPIEARQIWMTHLIFRAIGEVIPSITAHAL